MNKNTESLLNIFYSNSPLNIDYHAIGELEYLIEKELIAISTRELCNINKLHEIIDKINSGNIKAIDYQGGGIKHMALKKLGEDLLLSLNKKAKIESLFYNRYPDVISNDSSIIIECGDTDPNKILEYFYYGVAAIMVLPYPDSSEVNYYEFSSKDLKELQEYIKNKNSYFNDKIKQIINRKRFKIND
ncbi:MAG: hypothetical protein NT116_00790 [Candidatus Parcubacteria bacterium]|nr:hypothetical protein [Candidatus Parcubacteria bacterium]